jgi:RNA-directed DNA polymerase
LPGYTHKGTLMSIITDYDSLWESAIKCQKGVRWKPSAKYFIINAPEDIAKMAAQLENGTWKDGKPKEIKILYPKKRDGLSISYKDRVYQRSINDNALYPQMTRHFIFDNCACQKGKGSAFARRRIKEHLRNHIVKHGREGYVLQIDIHGYYPNMRHDEVKKCFKKHLDGETYQRVINVLDNQYAGDVGCNPGSQMVQIAGISLPNDIDHHIKEDLHVKHYIRYMDDFWMLFKSREEAEHVLDIVTKELSNMGFETNPKKTLIKPLSKGFAFLGFTYRVTDSGKIIMTVNSDCVRHERRKLYRLAQRCKRGEMPKSKADECYQSWKAHVSEGNSYKLLQRMDSYYKSLWREEESNESRKTQTVSLGTG